MTCKIVKNYPRGFIEGVGIADERRGQAQDPQHWRDSHYRVEGPAISQLQAAGRQAAQAFTSLVGAGAESLQLMVLMPIFAARSTLALSMAHFVP